MEENTLPTSPDTPPVEKKEEKVTWPGFTDHVREGWRKAHNKLGTGGVIAVVLALIILCMLSSHSSHHDRFERGFRGQGMNQDTRFDRAMMQDMKDSWDAMNERMDALENRHDDMIREAMNPVVPAEEATLVQPAMPGSNGQYSGYRVIDGQTINYSLRSREGTITGALIGTNTEWLKAHGERLAELGLTITDKNGQVQFTGPAEKLDEVIWVLNRD